MYRSCLEVHTQAFHLTVNTNHTFLCALPETAHAQQAPHSVRFKLRGDTALQYNDMNTGVFYHKG